MLKYTKKLTGKNLQEDNKKPKKKQEMEGADLLTEP